MMSERRFAPILEREKEPPPKRGSYKEFLQRLREIYPEWSEEDRLVFESAKPLFKRLSPEKRVHSRNVALHVATISADAHVIASALLHDTKERLPNAFKKASRSLPPDVVQRVEALSEQDEDELEEEENAPLAHLAEVLPHLEPELRNQVVLIKLADRLDNLQKRVQEGKISKSYRKKSKALLTYLINTLLPLEDVNELALHRLKDQCEQFVTKPQKNKQQKVA